MVDSQELDALPAGPADEIALLKSGLSLARICFRATCYVSAIDRCIRTALWLRADRESMTHIFAHHARVGRFAPSFSPF